VFATVPGIVVNMRAAQDDSPLASLILTYFAEVSRSTDDFENLALALH